MYVEELRNKIKTRKNGLTTHKYLPLIKTWEKDNNQSSWLTSCHKNGCGRTVIFEKLSNTIYQYRCSSCGDIQKVSSTIGRAILGF